MTTQTDILDAAEHLVRKRGYDGFSFADLAAKVGIRKPSVHYHFETKGALATTLITRYAERMANAREAIDAEAKSTEDALRQFAALYREALGQGDTICLCASFSADIDSLPNTARDALNSYYDETLAWLDTFGAAPTLLAAVEGAQLLARARQNPATFDDAIEPILARFNTDRTLS